MKKRKDEFENEVVKEGDTYQHMQVATWKAMKRFAWIKWNNLLLVGKGKVICLHFVY